MKNRLSHIAPFLFLAFLTLPLVALLLLQGTQWCLQTTAGLRMNGHELVTVSLPAEAVVWHKAEKELTIQGKLFDVKQYRVANGTLTATGYFDEEETSVIYLLSRLARPEKSGALLQFVLALHGFILLPLFFWLGPENRRLVHHTAFSFFLPTPPGLMAEKPPQSTAICF